MRWKLGLTILSLFCISFSISAEDTKSEFLNPADWEGLKEYWKVEGDTVTGESKEGLKFNTFLCSKKKYSDFEMSFDVRLKNGGGNSGIQIRSEIFNNEKFAVRGPQADIGHGYWGSLYGENFNPETGKGGGGMMKASDPKLVNPKLNEKDFNHYSIKCVKNHVTIKVNEVLCVDQEFKVMPETGILAFQLHAGGPMEVIFKNIKFKDLAGK